ncbi:MAG: septum formation initiator family protein [bacterium]
MRRIILYVIIIFQIILIISLVRGIQLSRRSVSRIASMQETKEKLRLEQEKLKEEGKYVQSDYYLEKVAREELHLSKPGETVVIVPDSQIVSQLSESKPLDQLEKPNWQKWLKIFTGSD